MAWWDNVLNAFERFGEWLGGDRDEVPEETADEPGGFFGGDEPPDEPSGSADFDPDDYIGYHAGDGPYDPDWGENEAAFWDTVMDGHLFEGQSQYDEVMEAFNTGWIDQGVLTEERNEAREYWTELTYMEMDWTAFDDYYSEL
jgi:hypothetical protein